MIAVRLTVDQASPTLDRLKTIAPEKLLNIGGRGVVNSLRTHFQNLQSTRPNKNNWPRQNFWDDVRRSVSFALMTSSFVITVNHVGAALRLLGGVVKPVNKKFLTIPARAEAYGKSAREFNLHPLYGAHGPYALALSASEVSFGKARKDGSSTVRRSPMAGGLVMFWLVKEAVHQPDPTVVPTEEAMREAALVPIQEFVDRHSGGVS